MTRAWLVLCVVCAALLAGCASDAASYLVDGDKDKALTIVRVRNYPWQEGWQLEAVVRFYPECERRHRLKDAGAAVKMELYSPEPGVFIVRQGKRWYVAELKSCRMELFDQDPAAPGELLGTFQVKGERFRFVEAAGENARDG